MSDAYVWGGPTCRGCTALGTACGHCEKCLWEKRHGRVWKGESPSDPTEEQLVECLAKAACVASGYDPEFRRVSETGDKMEDFWLAYRPHARVFLAMFKALQDG